MALLWQISEVVLGEGSGLSLIVIQISPCGPPPPFFPLHSPVFQFMYYIMITYLLTYLLTYSMVQSPSWEANWFAASQEIPRISWNPEGSLPHSQASATCPYPGPTQSSPHTHIPPPGDPS